MEPPKVVAKLLMPASIEIEAYDLVGIFMNSDALRNNQQASRIEITAFTISFGANIFKISGPASQIEADHR